jgi:putative DNA methylase
MMFYNKKLFILFCVNDLGEDWPGASGLAEDVRYYGKWMRDEAEKRIGHLYPKAKLPDGSEATVIAWLWARTVKCPNPACGTMMPLVKSFALSTKIGKEARVNPIVDSNCNIRFEVKAGQGDTEGTVNRQGAQCIACGTPIKFDYIRSKSRAKMLDSQLMAIVAEGKRNRIYLSPERQHYEKVNELELSFKPNNEIEDNPGHTNVYRYGLTTFGDLFTSRQLIALTTFSDLALEARKRVLEDAQKLCLTEGTGIEEGGQGIVAYAEAIATFLAFLVDQLSNHHSNICGWNSVNAQMRTVFARQAIPMIWDYAECNPFCDSSGSFNNLFERLLKGFYAIPANSVGHVKQLDSSLTFINMSNMMICTDPPYYDNIGYAELSDFFYVWLRRSLKEIYPEILSTILVPKTRELVAAAYRFEGDKEKAREFFEKGLKNAFKLMFEVQDKQLPATIFYAFKQSEKAGQIGNNSAAISTGWETMLGALLDSGFCITGTWPIRTEKIGRVLELGTNALSSSIVLVCRPLIPDASLATRREFLISLKQELPEALRQLQKGNIAPVDLAQAAIGPGMAIFSRYSKVLEADGSPMQVRTALQLINQHLDEYLSEQEGEYDPDTRWTLSWFEQYGMKEGSFGDAETLSKAKNISVEGLVQSGILKAGGGKVRLLKREEMDQDWDPATDKRLSVWEMTQHLIRRHIIC